MADKGEINSSEAALYDRQIRLWGVKAQNALKNSQVLCVGLNALGAELCKNIVLAGLNITILDSHTVTPRDLGAQFFLSQNDVGKQRAAASAPRIQALNPFANVQVVEGTVAEKPESFFAPFNVVLLVNQDYAAELKVNKACRKNGTGKFIAARSQGFFASAFLDFQRHEYVVTGKGGSIVSEAPVVVNYVSLEDSAKQAWGDLDKQLKYGVSPLYFCEQASRESSQTEDDEATAVAAFVETCAAKGVPEDHIPKDVFRRFHANQGSHLAPVCAIMGGLLGQEVIKVISAQNKPSNNWLFLDGLSSQAVAQRLVIEAKVPVEIPDDDNLNDLLSDSE